MPIMKPSIDGAAGQREVIVDQDARRLALIERLGTFADLLCKEPLPGTTGDVAYELLRQAAAQISSDRLHLARLSQPAVKGGEHD